MTPEPTLTPQQPQPIPSADERNWALLAHLSGLFSGFLVPLLILLTKGKESPWVRAQTVEALNFHLTITVGLLLSVPLAAVLIGLCTAAVLGAYSLVFAIIAGLRAYAGESYRYPFSLRLIS